MAPRSAAPNQTRISSIIVNSHVRHLKICIVVMGWITQDIVMVTVPWTRLQKFGWHTSARNQYHYYDTIYVSGLVNSQIPTKGDIEDKMLSRKETINATPFSRPVRNRDAKGLDVKGSGISLKAAWDRRAL